MIYFHLGERFCNIYSISTSMKSKDNGFSDIPVINDQVASLASSFGQFSLLRSI